MLTRSLLPAGRPPGATWISRLWITVSLCLSGALVAVAVTVAVPGASALALSSLQMFPPYVPPLAAGVLALVALSPIWRGTGGLKANDRKAAASAAMAETLRRQNAALATSEASYRAFFEHAEDSLCDVEVAADGRFVCRNINPHAEAVMGVTTQAIRGLTPEQILGLEAGGRITAALHRCMEQNGLRYEEIWATVRGPRLTDTIMVPLRDAGAPEGRVVRILCSMRDITDRRNLETQLAQGQKLQALGQLAGGIAHDFNNVLQAIEGSASLIGIRASDRDAVLRLARVVEDAAGRGSSITRRLLAFARRDELHAEAVDATALLGDLREVLASTLGAGIAVKLGLAPDLPRLLADRGQLETALVNLSTNARDAMPRGGSLTLRARAETLQPGTLAPAVLRPGAYVRIDVIDTGAGMDAATLGRAGEPFFTTKPRGQGTGLGLSMARGFAEQSGGTLAIASELGRGTTISLWLPQAAGLQPVAAPRNGYVGRDAAPDSGPSVLVVDDDPLVRETLCAHLAIAGYRVRGAQDGGAALAMMRDGGDPDLLLTDLSMPGMDGLSLVREAQRQRPSLPAILLTGYAGDAEGLRGEDVSNARFAVLRKPVSANDLLSRIASLLASAKPKSAAEPPFATVG